MHRKVAAALVAALALAAAGCGGSESLTRAQVVTRLEAACRLAQERTAEESRGARTENFFAALLVGQRVLVKRIDGIEPPDELSDDVETVKTGFAERTDMVARVADTPRAERERAIRALNTELSSVTRDLEGALRRLGVRDCG
ncbi:MAG TPA: hypothetical protein VK506_09825 [Conexibacter sp.]|nr:hypothetical protein [Conexibacter sp.]